MMVSIDSSLDGIDNAQGFYASLGFRAQPEFWSAVSGAWLDNDANR